MKSKKTNILIQWIAALLILMIFFPLRHCSSDGGTSTTLSPDNRAAEWSGNQSLPRQAWQEDSGIAIPGFNELAFYENQNDQQVNFYNPATNDCLFLMTLFVNEEQLWQSGYVAPGTGFYEIELDHSLQAGEYDCCLKIQCFRENGEELNSANVNFHLYVIQK